MVYGDASTRLEYPCGFLKWGIQKTLVSILRWSNLADFRVPPFNLGILHMGIVITYIVITPNDPADILGQHCTSGIKNMIQTILLMAKLKNMIQTILTMAKVMLEARNFMGKSSKRFAVRCICSLASRRKPG